MRESPLRTPDPGKPGFRLAEEPPPSLPPAPPRGAAVYDRLREEVDRLELQTDLWWLALLFSGLLSALLGGVAFADHGIFWAYLSVFVRLALVVGLTQQAWGGIYAKLLPLGLVAGVFSVFSDYMAIHWFNAGQLTYPAGQGLVLGSPLYGPLFWAVSFVEFGYASLRIFGILPRKFPGETGRVLAMAVGGSVAALTIGCHDSLATMAGWWKYRSGHAVSEGGFAFYVLASKFFVFLCFLPVFARYAASPGGRLLSALRFGIILGGVIFMSTAVSYLLVMGFFV